MSKLTGLEIKRQVELGNIRITPYDENRINPNSYNIRLAPDLKVYKQNSKRWENDQMHPCVVLDSRKVNETIDIKIPEDGFELKPGVLYIGSTIERTYTDKYVPIIDGRSSIGRLGINIHATAGFGDIGFDGTWTLEISVIHNTIIYPDMEIGQISFDEVIGDTSYQYNGRYNKQNGPVASRIELNKIGTFNDYKERN